MRIINAMFIATVVTGLIACETTQQQDGEVDNLQAENDGGNQGNNTADNGENYGNDEGNGGNEGNNYGNFGNDEGYQGDDGEFVNNAGDEEGGDDQFAFFNNQGQNQGEGINNAPLEEGSNTLTNVPPLNPVPDAGQSANEIPQVPQGPSGGGIVKYAPGPVTVYNSPNGSAVGTLEQGDHPLVYDETGWSRMYDGRYVSQDSLSPRGVGRPREETSWN